MSFEVIPGCNSENYGFRVGRFFKLPQGGSYNFFFNRNRRLLVLNLTSRFDLDALYVHRKYLDEKSYLNAQVHKKRQLEEFKQALTSIFWTSSLNIEQLSGYNLKDFLSNPLEGCAWGVGAVKNSRSLQIICFFENLWSRTRGFN